MSFRHFEGDYFAGAGLSAITPQCLNCVWRLDLATCQAFPSGIPHAIALNKFDHRKPWPLSGDGGKRWEPRDPAIPHPLGLDFE